MNLRPHRRIVPLILAPVLAGSAFAADLPHRHHVSRAAARMPPAERAAPFAPAPLVPAVVVPAVPLAPVIIAPPPSGIAFTPVLPDPVLAPRRGGCRPGFMADADGACRRNGELLVACEPFGGPCEPVPPTPIPYGIGPYLRTNY